MNLLAIDLNLLVILRSLLATLSVSRTARDMGLSQPAVSHALGRLRDLFKDDLLVRSSRSMVATPLAKNLSLPLQEALAHLEAALQREEFDPAKAGGVVRIQATEYFEQLAVAPILIRLQREAPGIRLVFTPTPGYLPKHDLAEGGCALAIAGFFGELPEGYFQQPLFADRLVCLHGGGQRKALSLDEYLNLKHVYISPEGKLDGGNVDQILAKHTKKKRQIVASVAGFSAPAWICANPGFSCTMPERLAKLYAKRGKLEVSELPFATPAIQVVQVWHQRTHRDPLFRYVRGVIREECSKIFSS